MSGNEEIVKNSVCDAETEIKRYLELDNVSILAGAGTSFHLGAPIIRTVPDDLAKSCAKGIEKYFGKVRSRLMKICSIAYKLNRSFRKSRGGRF